MKELTAMVAGHPAGSITFRPEAQCGNIRNGVAFALKGEGSWVIPFRSLERFYRLAKERRTAK